uniref:CCHC-type domain-containing protein n=1 Tax=Piliocolobus tephrosceles TaxID=591936 RepID=A0A8C9ITD3_9PRIM
MTRWARVSTACNKRPLSITPWEDVKKGSFEGTSQNLPKCKHLEANRLSLKNDKHQGKHKNNKEKKEYLNKDVNAVMEYLRQNSQMVHKGQIIIRALECHRCGSTEYETTKCKAKVHPGLGEFLFATCFVCGEMGSLSRSCPDNPKGLYADVSCWAKGMSADYEEILDAPKLQKPKTEIPKVVNFW